MAVSVLHDFARGGSNRRLKIDMADPRNNNNMADPRNNNNGSSSATAMPMAVDGSEEDSALSRSEFLTRQEVLKRRSRRLRQLVQIYTDHYWSLMEELKFKYREYYWEYGISPFQEDDINRGNNSATQTTTEENGKLGLGLGANVNPNRCDVHGCKLKAMALTKFCHSHILSDTNQKLYRGCTYITKSSPTAPTQCMKPILRSAVPPLCPLHLQKAEKHVTRALRKVGLNVTSTSKLSPKFNVLIAEFVHQIQSKRRAARGNTS